MYCKDMIVSAARRRWTMDLEVVEDLLTERATEFLDALESENIFEGRYFDGAHFKRIDQENGRILNIREKHRASAAQWSWVAFDL